MNGTTLSAEKRANANWAQCAACEHWFPVGGALLARPEIELHCPKCGQTFLAEDAKRLVRAA
jgi:hypothetical protein